MSDQEPSEEDITQPDRKRRFYQRLQERRLYDLAVRRMSRGASEDQIQSILAGKGVDRMTAAIIIYNLKRLHDLAASGMTKGASEEQIQSILVDEGLDRKAAERIINNLKRTRPDAVREAGTNNMFYGALWCIGGIIVAAVTYRAAYGELMSFICYVFSAVATLLGSIQFSRGLRQLSDQ